MLIADGPPVLVSWDLSHRSDSEVLKAIVRLELVVEMRQTMCTMWTHSRTLDAECYEGAFASTLRTSLLRTENTGYRVTDAGDGGE